MQASPLQFVMPAAASSLGCQVWNGSGAGSLAHNCHDLSASSLPAPQHHPYAPTTTHCCQRPAGPASSHRAGRTHNRIPFSPAAFLPLFAHIGLFDC